MITRRVLRWGNGAYNVSPVEVGECDEVDWIHVTDETTGLHVHICSKKDIDNYSNRKFTKKEKIILEDIAEQTNWRDE